MARALTVLSKLGCGLEPLGDSCTAKKMRDRFLPLVAALLVGCVTVPAVDIERGTPISEAELAAFKVGETTVEKVISTLGPPGASTVKSDGSRMITYAHTHLKNNQFRITSVSFSFGTDGKLIDYSISQNNPNATLPPPEQSR